MESDTVYAICILNPDMGTNVKGVVKFIQPKNGKTIVDARVENLPKGKHGFHIHKWGNLIEGCKTAGDHFNPENKDHGGPFDSVRHIGDMGNIESDGNGVATLCYEDPFMQLSGPYSIIGRAAVVHADEDDLGKGGFPDSKTTGHSGARIACGVVGMSDTFDYTKPKM